MEFVSLLKRVPGFADSDEIPDKSKSKTKKKKVEELNFVEVAYEATIEQIYNLIKEKNKFSV